MSVNTLFQVCFILLILSFASLSGSLKVKSVDIDKGPVKSTIFQSKSNLNRAILKSTISLLLLNNFKAFPAIANAEDILSNEKLTTRQVIIRKTENFLMNPILEGIRKIDQLDPDTDASGVDKVISLVPIVEINREIEQIVALIKDKQVDSLKVAQEILKNTKYDTPVFKKIFNRYSDNIYYTDPKRANLYLGGGALPNSVQTQQYLYRNEALTGINNIKEDLVSLLSSDINKVDEQSYLDTLDDCQEVLDALKQYFILCNPEDLKLAKAVVFKSVNE